MSSCRFALVSPTTGRSELLSATPAICAANREIFTESGVKLENIINPPKVPGNRDGYVYVLVEYSTDAVKSLNHKAIETCKGCGEKRREMEWTRNYCKKCSAKRKQANEQKEEKAARKKAKKSQGADQKPPPPPPATDTA